MNNIQLLRGGGGGGGGGGKLRKDFINQLPYPLVPAHT
jgi:hypothetical protein